MFRYFAFVWDAHSDVPTLAVKDWERRLQSSGHWVSSLSAEGVRVWITGAMRQFKGHPLPGGAGIVMGEIYERQRDMLNDVPADPAIFTEAKAREVLLDRGKRLMSQYWGNYVALLRDSQLQTTLVLKDPAGSLPCYVVACGGVQIIFSHLADCLNLRVLQLHVNWTFVRSRIANSVFEVENDPWLGVSSVHRGECLTINSRGECAARAAYWHPRTFSGARDVIDDPETAAQALRATVRSCVHTLARPHRHVVQQTSGGLDSSIVLSALGDAPHGPEVICYTAYCEDAPCDERRWARLAARAGGHRHMEVPYDVTGIRLDTLPPLAPSVYPPSVAGQWDRGPLERSLSAESNASAVFTGDGGDSGFCATSYVFAVDHALKRYGFSRRTFSTAVLVAARRDRTAWRTLGDALRRRRHGSNFGDYLRLMSSGRQLLHAETSKFSKRFPNPWFSDDCSLDMESIWRLGTLAFAPDFYDLSIAANEAAPLTVSPLCSQPVFEVCRRIPVDVHFDGGRIRGLARRAFQGLVPKPILDRQWKDRPIAAPATIVRGNLPFIREMLLDGHLSENRILDRTALEAALSADPNRQRAVASEILGHLDIELWLRGSISRCVG